MSHELTVFEWTNRLTNEFNELRIAASDVIKMKLVEFFSDASVFIVNHSSELLYGSLSVFMVVIFTILYNRTITAENASEKLATSLAIQLDVAKIRKHNIDSLRDDLECEQVSYLALEEKFSAVNMELDEMKLQLADSRIDNQALTEERDNLREDRDQIRAELDEMETERDEFEDSRDEWMADANQYESERDELSDELDNLKSAVPQLAYAA